MIIVSIFAGLAFIFSTMVINSELQNQPTGEFTNQSFKVYPDMLKVNGASFSYLGRLDNKQPNVIFYGRFKTLAQKQQVSRADKPLRLTVSGKIADFNPATNVNQFDARRYYHHQKVAKVVVIKDIQSFQPVMRLTLVDRLHWLRSRFNHYCETLPKTLKIYALGLLSGSREADFFSEMTGVKQLGLLHIFSISGMHVYYFLAIIDQCLGLFRLPKAGKATVELMSIGAYFVFSGGSPGLFRAVVMAVIAILNRLFNSGLSRLDIWSLSLIINLLMMPEAMFLMGVQLSYGLSFGLIVAADFSFVKQTLLLNMLTLPILLYHIYEWHVLSVAVNLIVLPMFGKFIFPLVIIGTLVGLAVPVLVLPIDWLLKSFNDTLNWASTLPGLVTFGKPALVIVIMMLILTLGLALKRGRPKVLLAGLLTLYLGTFLVIHLPLNGEVVMFDVGQGDSFLIRTPFNRTVTLIDTGGKVDFSRTAWEHGTKTYQADRLSINYLKSVGISKIDFLCVSHQDADHCGDLPAFIHSMRIGTILMPLGMDQNPSFMKRIEDRHQNTKLVPINDESKVVGLPLSILHPHEPGLGENHDSMVLATRVGGMSWLFTGDLDRLGEMDTLARHPDLKIDVLKAGHHGSRTSSDPQFIYQVKPKIALISAGRNNRYHHPNIETIQTLNQAGIKIYNTQTQGMVRYRYRQQSGHFETVLHQHEGMS
ncbi:DNA internalization-related competence protein ComEC/Rec2 [Lentilactobacillus fungorum]|nr:DNA internalization-related competence protein ComEC/Rec2 [Lentilactobacillus fungorum]